MTIDTDILSEIKLHIKALELENPEWLKLILNCVGKSVPAISPEETMYVVEGDDYIFEFAHGLSEGTQFCVCSIENPLTQCRQEKCDWYVPIVRMKKGNKIKHFRYSGTQRSLN